MACHRNGCKGTRKQNWVKLKDPRLQEKIKVLAMECVRCKNFVFTQKQILFAFNKANRILKTAE